MNLHPEKDTYSQAGNWLMGTARRHPEALLLLAAGCALLMRSSGSSSSRASTHSRHEQSDFAPPSASGRGQSSARQGLSRAVESAADYASDIKDQVSDLCRRLDEHVAAMQRRFPTLPARPAAGSRSSRSGSPVKPSPRCNRP